MNERVGGLTDCAKLQKEVKKRDALFPTWIGKRHLWPAQAWELSYPKSIFRLRTKMHIYFSPVLSASPPKRTRLRGQMALCQRPRVILM